MSLNNLTAIETMYSRLARMSILVMSVLLPMTSVVRAQTQSAPSFSPSQEAAIQTTVREYLLAHPEVVAQALQEEQKNLEAAQNEASKIAIATNERELFDDPETPVIGNPSGEVTMIEFSDYQCPYCKAMTPIVQSLIAENKNLRILMKDLPIFGQTSEYAARVGLLASKQGKYEAYRRAVASQPPPLDEQKILNAAVAAGLRIAALTQEIDSSWVDSELAEDEKLAASLRIDGTPTFVVGDFLIKGETSEKYLQNLIDGKAEPSKASKSE